MSLQCVWGRRSGHWTAWHFLWQSPSFGVMEAYEVDRSSQVCKDAGSLHLSVTCQVTRVIYSCFTPMQWREGQTHTKTEPCPDVGQRAVNLTHKNNTKRKKFKPWTPASCTWQTTGWRLTPCCYRKRRKDGACLVAAGKSVGGDALTGCSAVQCLFVSTNLIAGWGRTGGDLLQPAACNEVGNFT